ncbi:hypothetical protein [Granulicella sp. dw_53]|uniref:hypothetical protein n=1 Tax=Granulicella sp. dw_53 TaxID=2719792 RepID=UPI001BD5AB6D|nr:hypothetical protein [Granulicella sp. dw_53]
MLPTRLSLTAALIPCLFSPFCLGQRQTPRDYPGVRANIPGIFVTPVPNQPFSAKLDIVSHEKLPDGSDVVRTSTAHIARTSSGRIYNERRALVPASFKEEPVLLSALIYDPSSRLSISLAPFTRLARETILNQTPTPPPNTVPAKAAPANRFYKEENIGTQPLGALTLRGIRKSRTIPAEMSGTGQEVVVVDEYWYSPDLTIYMIIKHNDPRTGEQIVAVSDVNRHEPDAALFTVPANYKIVDETPTPPMALTPATP